MSRLAWDQDTKRLYQTGVKNCVIYPKEKDGHYTDGIAWSGVTRITKKLSGAESTSLYANDKEYVNILSLENIDASLTAYTYPDEFEEVNGSFNLADGVYFHQQEKKTFGLCYKSILGNDTKGNSFGYLLHIIYGATASASERSYKTENEFPEAIEFSWDIFTIPEKVKNKKETASIEINSNKCNLGRLFMLEMILYGTDYTAPRLPSPDEVVNIMSEHDDSWMGGVFPLFDSIAYPYDGLYEKIILGTFPKIDERRF